MSRREFHYSDDKSNKFWTIELEDDSFTVHFGRTGTNGQTQTKEFASPDAAKKEYEKLIAEKVRKGYQETGGGAAAAAPAAAASTAQPAAATAKPAAASAGKTAKAKKA